MADIPYDRGYMRPYRPATHGGRGSFSFADTSVHGARGLRVPQQIAIYNTLTGGVMGYLAGGLIPGAGGGARPKKELLVGSPAQGYSPHGIVVIRLTKIDD